jgi:hypothetical protein
VKNVPLKYFRPPKDIDSYLSLLNSQLRRVKDEISEKCVSSSDSSFELLIRKRERIKKEIKKVKKL